MKNHSSILILITALILIVACTAKPIQKTDQMSMEGMAHGTAITAHAGNDKSADVHLYAVNFNQPVAETGQEASLEFKITEKESGKPTTELETVHEKPMHLVLVSNDLKHFDHIHPKLKDGSWVVEYSFKAAGKYRIWIDFTKDGVQHIVDFDLSVSGRQEAEEQDSLYGLRVKMLTSNKIITNNDVSFEFEVTDIGGKPVPITEKFLAANAHVITIDESLQEFAHTHDMNFDKDNILSFKPFFSKSGNHKAWVQFSVNGKVRTASFDFLESITDFAKNH